MSFKLLSTKLKKSFNKRLSSLAFKIENNKKRTSWNVLITGGAGHLAENLVEKLIETVQDEIRPDIFKMIEVSDTASYSGERLRKLMLKKKIESELNLRLPSCIQIVLLDLIEPSEKILKYEFVKFIKGSFTDLEMMNVALNNIDTVYHLAAVGMTGQFATNRKACMDINAVGTMNLLSWCRQKGVQRFIYTSSVGVIFNGEPLINATEEVKHSEKFYNYYCESKAHAEKIVQNASCPELKTTVLRFNGIYGPGEKRVTERVVSFMLSGWWIAICRPNGIEAQTQLSSVDNCVRGLVKAELALRPKDSKHAQIYNIMDRDPVGTFSFWSPLNKALGFTDSMIDIPPCLMRFGGFFCQSVADIFKVDPFMTSLEVDLLIVNNTFSIDKACTEIGYDPAPSAMSEIVELYRRDIQSPNVKAQRKRILIWKFIISFIVAILVFVILTIILLISWNYLSQIISLICFIFVHILDFLKF